MRNLFKKIRKRKKEKGCAIIEKKKVDQKLEGKGANTTIRATQSKVKVFCFTKCSCNFLILNGVSQN